MNDTNNRMSDARVLNFSTIDLSCEHLLDTDFGDVAALVKTIRRYADLPFVWVVSREKTSLVLELLAALKTIRSTCYPYAVFTVGGIWSQYANTTSQVNSSECSYRLLEKNARSNRDHSYTREILEDIALLTGNVKDQLYLETEVEKITKSENSYTINTRRDGNETTIESTGVILAINDRVGPPREIAWKNQAAFQGQIVSGISDGTRGIDWRDKNVVIVGMGAFAIENARTALEAGARHGTVVCRRHGTICPKIIDYPNFATPYDDAFKHDKKNNMRNMMYWKKLYDLSGATQPEC